METHTGQGVFCFFFLYATFPFDILKAISSAMHTIALHNRTWNAAFLTLHWDKRQHLYDRMARQDYRTQTSILEWFLWKGERGKLRKLGLGGKKISRKHKSWAWPNPLDFNAYFDTLEDRFQADCEQWLGSFLAACIKWHFLLFQLN